MLVVSILRLGQNPAVPGEGLLDPGRMYPLVCMYTGQQENPASTLVGAGVCGAAGFVETPHDRREQQWLSETEGTVHHFGETALLLRSPPS